MDLNTLKEWFTLENIMELIKAYRSFGPLPRNITAYARGFSPFSPVIFICYGECKCIWSLVRISIFLDWRLLGCSACLFAH